MPVATVDPAATTRSTRVASIDIVRGAVMVLMAIDHVRVYSGVPAGGPTAAVFFTRWMTHFCAPAFVFFAGTSAFLAGRRRTREQLSRRLAARGLWLIALELTVIRLAWTFNLDYAHYILAGVIWAIGCCMILLALLVRLRTRTIAVVGLAIIFGQQILLPLAASTPASLTPLWRVIYLGGIFRLGANGPAVAVLYAIVPWIGVMAAGYAFGEIVMLDPRRRDRVCLWIGTAATGAFLIAGGILLFAAPPRSALPPLFRLLNQQKYPASQLFLMMTLGPTIALLPAAERLRGPVASFLTTFGRVPLFYYLLHIPTIHAAAIVVSLVREGRVDPWLFANHPMLPPPPPPGYMWSLPLLYLVFAIVIAVLYLPCAWYAARKP